MGTSNFHNINARNVYAVLMNYEAPVVDEEGNETDELEYHTPDTWEVDDFICLIKEDAEELADKSNFSYHGTIDPDPHELRSYSSIPLFQFFRHRKFGDIGVSVNINCVARVGYYEGANLDWYVTYNICGDDTDEIDFLSSMQHYSYMPAGMIKIQAKNAELWAAMITDELIDATEEFFKKNSMPLGVTARFSNGETVYSKI